MADHFLKGISADVQRDFYAVLVTKTIFDLYASHMKRFAENFAGLKDHTRYVSDLKTVSFGKGGEGCTRWNFLPSVSAIHKIFEEYRSGIEVNFSRYRSGSLKTTREEDDFISSKFEIIGHHENETSFHHNSMLKILSSKSRTKSYTMAIDTLAKRIRDNRIIEFFISRFEIINWNTNPNISSWHFDDSIKTYSGLLKIVWVNKIPSRNGAGDYAKFLYAEDDMKRPYIFSDKTIKSDHPEMFSRIGQKQFAEFKLSGKTVIAGRLGSWISDVNF